MKRVGKWFIFILLLFLLVLLSGYFLLAFYYREGFSLNTWINGVYCTGRTVEEVNSELLSRMEAPIVVITDKNGRSYQMDLQEVDYSVDYQKVLQIYRQEQNPYLWVDNLTLHRTHTVVPEIFYDEEKLRSSFEKLGFVTQDRLRNTTYELNYEQNAGFQECDGLRDRLDVEKAYAALLETIQNGEETLDLEKAGCYYDVTPTKEQQRLQELWKEIETYQNCDIVYCFGEDRREFTAGDMVAFLETDGSLPIRGEDGRFVLKETAVKEFISTLAAEYDTYGKTRQFQSTRGDVVTVKGGTYGSRLDQKAEVGYLLENLLSDSVHTGRKQEHIPVYEREAYVYGKDDIGKTYIEVDMTEQKLYYYEKGELLLETDIVTGNTGRRMGTPEGVNFVYNKQKNRILRGPGYASPVKFWMPVKGNIGIHDAGWRKEFGGTIYKTNGSHGCINTPTEKMEELYDMVEIGTPVIMFY